MIRTKTAKLLLSDARYIWRNTGIRKGWSIRDCVELAADDLRQWRDERRYERADTARVNAGLNWMAEGA